MTEIRRIGVLTSGGDCAGLNAVIRAITSRAIDGYGWEVVGIRNGTAGLLERPVSAERLTIAHFPGTLMRMGGTVLGTSNRNDPFHFPDADGAIHDRSGEVIEGWRSLGIDALVGIGGDGSLQILRRLAQQGEMALVGCRRPSTTTWARPMFRSAIRLP